MRGAGSLGNKAGTGPMNMESRHSVPTGETEPVLPSRPSVRRLGPPTGGPIIERGERFLKGPALFSEQVPLAGVLDEVGLSELAKPVCQDA